MGRQLVVGIVALLAVLVVLSVVFYSSRTKITGEVIEEIEDVGGTEDSSVAEESEGECEVLAEERYVCSGRTLIEYYCEAEIKKSRTQECDSLCDEGQCVEFVTKYTRPSSGGGGGGGGGGSSGGVEGAEELCIYDSQEFEFSRFELGENEGVNFDFGGGEYTLSVFDLAEVIAELRVDDRAFVLEVGREIEIDLDSDEQEDVSIRLVSINLVTKKANLILS